MRTLTIHSVVSHLRAAGYNVNLHSNGYQAILDDIDRTRVFTITGEGDDEAIEVETMEGAPPGKIRFKFIKASATALHLLEAYLRGNKVADHPEDTKVAYSDSLIPGDQIDAEEEIAAAIWEGADCSEERAGDLGRHILYLVLRRFRPDVFVDSTSPCVSTPGAGG